MTTYAYSKQEDEGYRAEGNLRDVLAEALADIEDEGDGREHFWIGEVEYFSPVDLAGTVIDDLQQQAYAHADEYSEGYLDGVTPEQRQELEDFLQAWAARIENPSFYQVGKVKKWTIYEAQRRLEALDQAAQNDEAKSQ
jgi:hypothetical protein